MCFLQTHMCTDAYMYVYFIISGIWLILHSNFCCHDWNCWVVAQQKSHWVAALHGWSGWRGRETLLSRSACWRSLGADQTRASTAWLTWPADSARQTALSAGFLRLIHNHTGVHVQQSVDIQEGRHLLWTCSGHQMCALSSDSSAPGWQFDGFPWTPAELH